MLSMWQRTSRGCNSSNTDACLHMLLQRKPVLLLQGQISHHASKLYSLTLQADLLHLQVA